MWKTWIENATLTETLRQSSAMWLKLQTGIAMPLGYPKIPVVYHLPFDKYKKLYAMLSSRWF